MKLKHKSSRSHQKQNTPTKTSMVFLFQVKSPEGSTFSLKNHQTTRFLQCTNLTFGFAAAWLGGYVGRHIFTETLSSEFIGFAGRSPRKMGD
jgi:hypothetical protein